MRRLRTLTVFLGVVLLAQGLGAQLPEPDISPELMRLIRKEKFDVILPQVMRDNQIDMWIYAKGADDSLDFELGEDPGIYIFTDRGGDRIERALFGGRGDEKLYDIFGARTEVASFVAERDPKRIALNDSGENPGYNTISDSDRTEVLEALGETYGDRVVPADRLIAYLLAGRGMAEIALYGRLLMTSSEIIDGELDSIVPGETKLSEIAGNVFVRDLDGNEENNPEYVVQPGDLIGILEAASAKDFSEHNGGIGYVLREGETGLPPEVREIWEHALATRDIFRQNITAGRTGAEILDTLITKLEDAGYVYIDEDRYDPDADPTKTQVHIDFHALGRLVSQEEAPRISPWGWGRDLTIPLYHTFALEYMIHMPVPAWGKGKHLYICLHDGAMVTERGVEFPAPPLQGIRAIR